jgi:hypothetical protein
MSNTQGKNDISDKDRKALEALLIGNQDLVHLESLLDQFNMFEAIGVVRQELRHSDFLAFLLDPRQNHGLEDIFVKQLLQKALLAAENIDTPITPIDLDIWDLRQARVQREWSNIDILLLDDKHNLALIIENKIGSKEHSKQLQRYYKDIQQHYPNYSIVGLYLTPEGNQPTENTYISVSYNLICTILEDLIKSRGPSLKTDVLIVIKHYTSMLRRHIMSDSEIVDLCQRIYFKHQRALDLIYEHRPDRQATIQKELENLIQQQNNLKLISSSKTYIRFIVKYRDTSLLPTEEEQNFLEQMLPFLFINETDSLKLKILIGSGPQELRQKLLKMALIKPPFKPVRKTLTNGWLTIYQHQLLTSESYEDVSDDEIIAKLREQWLHFLKGEDFLKIRDAIIKFEDQ